MPSLRNRGNGPTRRSERLSEPPRKSTSRKRKNSEDNSKEQKVKMLLMTSSDGRKVDSCCWICHKPGQEQICTSCPRVFHNQCLKSTLNELTSHPGVCPECLNESVDGTELPASVTQQMLLSAFQYIIVKLYATVPEADEDLKHWPQHKYEVCYTMDFDVLTDHVKSGDYKSTAAFYGDAKWLYHNCYNVFGADHANTTCASKIVKCIKSELLDLETCFNCHTKNSSVQVDTCIHPIVTLCDKPHRLLWVKLKGYPYWPSKCLKVINGMAQVQFFGTHDRTTVKANTCFLMSEENPSGKKCQRSAYQNSIKEMNDYIKNYEKEFGQYKFAPPKTTFIPSDDENCVVKKRHEASCSLNVSLSSEVENENLNSSQDIEIIDDVEIAESENNALYESCDIIEITDEDEPGNAMSNSENGNCENQDEISGHAENTLEGVETCIASLTDEITLFEEGILHMSSPTLQNTSAEPCNSSPHTCDIFAPSTCEIGTLTEEGTHSEPIAGTSSGSHDAGNQHIEEVEVTYLNEKQRTRILRFPRTDLSTLSHPLVRSLVAECEEHIEDLTRNFVKSVGQFSHVPKLVQKFMIEVANLDDELQMKEKELEELERTFSRTPDMRKFYDALTIKFAKQLDERKAAERQKHMEAKSRMFDELHVQREKHLALRNSTNENKTFVDQATMTDGPYEPLPSPEWLEMKTKELQEEMRLKFEKDSLEAKRHTWCKKCLNLATIHCCGKTNYCGDDCKRADLMRHAPMCRNPN